MKRTTLIAAALIMCSGTVCLAQTDRTKATRPATTPATATAQPAKPDAKGQPGGEAAEMMKKMEEAGAVTEKHKVFEKFAGTWDTTVKHWMNPGETPMESTGKAEQKLVYGGRFVHSKFEGDFMGQKFEGFGVLGYDNVAKAYQSTFHCNMGTNIMLITGQYDASSKSFTFKGECSCPLEADGTQTLRNVVRWTGENSYVEEMYTTGPDGKEFKMMEMSYKRSGAAKADASGTSRN